MEVTDFEKRFTALEDTVKGLSAEIVGRAKEQITDNLKGDFDEKFKEINTLKEVVKELRQAQAAGVETRAEPCRGGVIGDIAKTLETRDARPQSFEVRNALASEMLGGPVEFLGIAPVKQSRFTIFDLIPVRYRSALAYNYSRVAFGGDAGVVGEGGEKPLLNPIGGSVEMVLRKIAAYAEVSLEAEMTADEIGEDIEAVVRTRLYNKIIQQAEWQALRGDGVTITPYGGKQWNGLMPQATQYNGAQTAIDAIRLAIATVAENGGIASGIFLNPLDWAEIQTTKTENGAYILCNPAEGSGNRLWGIPVVDTFAMQHGSILTGAFDEGAAEIIIQRKGLVSIKGLKNDDLIRNQFTIVAELFGNVAVYDPAKLVKI